MANTDLKGKIAIVTGSTSGIGHGVASRFAANGMHVVLNGLGDAAEIEKTRKAMEDRYGVRVLYHGANMMKHEEIGDMVAYAVSELGGVHVLVNNAGIQHVAPIPEFSPEAWERIISINLSAVFYGTHYALPEMRKAGWGRVINIASAHGLVASANKSGYVAAKHGVVGLTKVTALETARESITANAICPGWVLTPLVEAQIHKIAENEKISFDAAKVKLLSEKQPSVEFVTPDQIGDLAVFLCSDAAAQISGSAYSIDGGWTAQ